MLVDDGSTDDTDRRARELADGLDLAVMILRHAQTSGPGRAFATGFAHLADRVAPDDLRA